MLNRLLIAFSLLALAVPAFSGTLTYTLVPNSGNVTLQAAVLFSGGVPVTGFIPFDVRGTATFQTNDFNVGFPLPVGITDQFTAGTPSGANNANLFATDPFNGDVRTTFIPLDFSAPVVVGSDMFFFTQGAPISSDPYPATSGLANPLILRFTDAGNVFFDGNTSIEAFNLQQISTNAAPEPATGLLLMSALVIGCGLRRSIRRGC